MLVPGDVDGLSQPYSQCCRCQPGLGTGPDYPGRLSFTRNVPTMLMLSSCSAPSVTHDRFGQRLCLSWR